MPEPVDRDLVLRAAREVAEQALRAGLPNGQLRVLYAVLSLTALEGRPSVRLYLRDLVVLVYGVDEEVPWMRSKTRAALRALADQGLIERRPPVGRPRTPSYFVGLPLGESHLVV